MKISVVTPSWNQGRFIQRCLESIRRGGGVEVQHIVLDNLSDDETPGILRQYAERRDGVERNYIFKKDNGQTAAINEGFALATGDIVCWLNTDEFYYENTLARVAEYFSSNPDVDVLYGNCDFYNSSGDIIKRRRSLDFYPGMLLYYGCYISSCATFVRRRVIDNGDFLDREFRVAMDYEWYVRLHSKGYKIHHIEDALAGFTWHESNISSTQKLRSKVERLFIQEKYGRVSGPKYLRLLKYRARAVMWRSVRILIRAKQRL